MNDRKSHPYRRWDIALRLLSAVMIVVAVTCLLYVAYAATSMLATPWPGLDPSLL